MFSIYAPAHYLVKIHSCILVLPSGKIEITSKTLNVKVVKLLTVRAKRRFSQLKTITKTKPRHTACAGTRHFHF